MSNGSSSTTSETTSKPADSGGFKLATFSLGGDKKEEAKDSQVEVKAVSNGKSTSTIRQSIWPS
jgi:hypothetical protein